MSTAPKLPLADLETPSLEAQLERCWYLPIESDLKEDQIMDVAACCHGIRKQGDASSSGTSLGAMRSCRQCGFIL